MAVQLQEKQDGKVLEVRVTGKLKAEDYEKFTPEVDKLIKQHGKVRMLFDMHDFHGWEASALWEDLKFGLGHFRDIERLALVGETKWQEGMSNFCKPFTAAEIRYFDRAKIEEAHAWIEADLAKTSQTTSKQPAQAAGTGVPQHAGA